jgi:hypothetical protein
VGGWVTIRGTATHEDFAYYKLEYGAGAHPTDWSWFYSSETPVWNGVLGNLSLPAGTYTIRLTVVDTSGNYPPPCQVTIVIC